MRQRLNSDRGASAVEFALVLPLLLLLVVGIAEFGRAYNVQISLSAAAREGARILAIQSDYDAAAVRETTRDAAPSVALTNGDISVSGSCPAGSNGTVTVTHNFVMLTGLLGEGFTLTGTGVMRCGG